MIPDCPSAPSGGRSLPLRCSPKLYLFRARRAIRSSRRSGRFKSRAVNAAGLFLIGVSAVNRVILYRPIPRVSPPGLARVGLFDPPAACGAGPIGTDPATPTILLSLPAGDLPPGGPAGYLAHAVGSLSRRQIKPVRPGRESAWRTSGSPIPGLCRIGAHGSASTGGGQNDLDLGSFNAPPEATLVQLAAENLT